MPLQMYVEPDRAGRDAPGGVHAVGGRSAAPVLDRSRDISAKRNDWIKEWTDLVVR